MTYRRKIHMLQELMDSQYYHVIPRSLILLLNNVIFYVLTFNTSICNNGTYTITHEHYITGNRLVYLTNTLTETIFTLSFFII